MRCKPVTAKGYRQVIDNHILPVLGKHADLRALGREHVADLQYRLRKTPTAANQRGRRICRGCSTGPRPGAWYPAGGNPCRSMAKYRTRRIERFLTEEEFRRLGEALDAVEAEGRDTVARGGGAAAVDADRVPVAARS